MFEQAEDLMNHLHKDDKENRSQLKICLGQLESILNEVIKNDRLRSHLEIEGVIENYQSEMATFNFILGQTECPIVVAGKNNCIKRRCTS